eukprot:TRINITY_DN931_c0_g1_i3.p1 TRINITY_DN931_c0_g1~~TRINITY_DN931_c0_g1_i3.p1  ORF type:complete len:427 (+),score=156.24 TRINITY_DN931_c0_g1_i3:86-1282(+)
MTTKVRSSKFRHVVGTPMQLRDTYGDILTGSCHSESTIIKANSKFFAMPWAPTGSVCIVPLARVGTVPEETPLVHYRDAEGDKCQVNELDLSPCADNLLLTAGNDGGLAVWDIPAEGLTANITTPTVRVQASEKRLLVAKFHPLASGIAVSGAADKVVKIWDIEAGGSEVSALQQEHKGLLTDLAWNHEGSMLATSCKDKKLRVFDARSGECVGEAADHQSPKSTHLAWAGKLDKIITAGFGRGSDRNLHVYDPRNLSARLSEHKLPAGSSVMHLMFDEDTGVLFVAGKGDGNILMFEVAEDAPFVHSLIDYKSTTPANGVCMLPKSHCDVMKCEIRRILKLSGKRVEPIRFEVPRSQTGFFHDDLFPPTWDHQPTMSSGEWAAGANNARNMVSLEPQ